MMNLLTLFLLPLCAEPVEQDLIRVIDLKPSGIRVLLCPLPRHDTYALAGAYRIGNAFDGAATSGYAHILEHHLIYRGSEFSSEDVLHNRWRILGGRRNGWTYPDYTLFSVYTGEKDLYQTLEMFREMLFHPVFSPVDLDRSRDILCHELDTRALQPDLEIYSLATEFLYGEHNYGLPTAGSKRVINQVSSGLLYERFDDEYSPARFTMAVAGTMENLEKLEDILQETFGTYRPGTVSPVELDPVSLLEKSTRKVAISRSRSAQLCFSFVGPPSNDKDWLPFVVMAHVLCGGDNSLLQKRLVYQDGIATRVDLTVEPRKMGGFAMFRIQLAPDRPEHMKRCEREVHKLLKRTVERPLDREEVNRVKNRLSLDYERCLEDSHSLVSELVKWDVLGKWSFPFNVISDLRALPLDNIKRIGTRFFQENRSSVVAVVPGTWPASARTDEKEELFFEKIKIEEETAFPLVSVCLPRSTKYYCAVNVKGGLAADKAGEKGLGGLVARAILRGAEGETGEVFLNRLTRYGVQLEAGTAQDYTYIRFSAQAEYFEDALERISRAIVEPSFNRFELEEVRRKLIAETEVFPSIMETAEKILWKRTFTGNEYDVFPPGKKESLKMLYRNLQGRVRDYWKTHWRPAGLSVAVAGPKKADQLAKHVFRALSSLSPAEAGAGGAPPLVLPEEESKIIVMNWSPDNGGTNSFLMHGWFVAESNEDNLATLLLLRELLAGGPGTRLWPLRQTEGLLYDLNAKVKVTRHVLGLELWFVLSAGSTRKVRDRLFRELEDLSDELVDEEQLEFARRGVMREQRRNNEQGLTLVKQHAWYLLAGWDEKAFLESVQGMTPRKFREQVRRFIRKENAWTVAIGPEALLKAQLSD